ncbi:DUF1552 domain-containing protein, partial [bacterium]|nr:DUF1552 domain-containing protein [bacterium]
SIRSPQKMYQRLFSNSETNRFREVTDLVLEDAQSLSKKLAYADQQKFQEFFDSIRTIEKQMGRLQKMQSELAQVEMEKPTEAYLPRGEFIRLMGDLMVVALQTGLTRVATFMVGPERWDTPYMFDGLFDKPRSHHGMSHNQTKMIDDLLRVDQFHMEQFAYLIQRMDGIQESNGTSLLDNTLFTYGSGLGDGSTHQYNEFNQSTEQLILTAEKEGGLADFYAVDINEQGSVVQLTETPWTEWGFTFSPDKKWAAYTSERDMKRGYEIYINRFPEMNQEIRLSESGGEEPDWIPDGSGIYYRNESKWYRVGLDLNGEQPQVTSRDLFFEGDYVNVWGPSHDIFPNGDILLLQMEPWEEPREIDIIVNALANQE